MPRPTCPNCNEPLEPIVRARGDTPPWNCVRCTRSWWRAELSAEVKASWSTSHRAFVKETLATLGPAIQEEAESAKGWGLSFTASEIPYISLQQLEDLRATMDDTPIRKKLDGLITSKERQERVPDMGGQS